MDVGNGYSYGRLFYRYQREGSARSAAIVIPRVIDTLAVRSVLDVGCGVGAWLLPYARRGVDVTGVDGDYVDRSLLLVDRDRFLARDIAKPFDLERTFDLVQSLEVAEHVPLKDSDTLVDNLVRHGKHVLFSAAVPGQGGENHVNEQPYEFWRDRFAERGFELFDFIRPAIAGRTDVEPWYRYNTLFFVHRDTIAALPTAIARTQVTNQEPIRDVSPVCYRARRAALRRLPEPAVTALAKIKHQCVACLLAARDS